MLTRARPENALRRQYREILMRKLSMILVVLVFAGAIFGGQIVGSLPAGVSDYAIYPFCILIAAMLWSLILDVLRLFKRKKKPPEAAHH